MYMSVLRECLVAAPFAINMEFQHWVDIKPTWHHVPPLSPARTDLYSSSSYLFKCVGAVIATKIADTIERAWACCADCRVGWMAGLTELFNNSYLYFYICSIVGVRWQWALIEFPCYQSSIFLLSRSCFSWTVGEMLHALTDCVTPCNSSGLRHQCFLWVIEIPWAQVCVSHIMTEAQKQTETENDLLTDPLASDCF